MNARSVIVILKEFRCVPHPKPNQKLAIEANRKEITIFIAVNVEEFKAKLKSCISGLIACLNGE